ncbi:MAG: hypothetical protein ACK4NC_02455 [Candidatus Gracilibacteria bacterium]
MRFSSSLILCLSLALLASCGTVEQSISQNLNSSGVLIENQTPISQKDFQAAVIAGNVDECKKASTKTLQEDCKRDFISLQAREEGDKLLCDVLETQNRESCINSVVLSKSQKDENIETCKELPSQQLIIACEDSIHHLLAEKKQDSTFCEKIQSSDLKNGCMAVIQKDADCNQFASTIDKDRCLITKNQYSAVMELVKDRKKVDCGTILDMDLRQLCSQEMGMINAVEKKDKKLCEGLSTSFSYGEIKEKDYQNECITSIKN